MIGNCRRYPFVVFHPRPRLRQVDVTANAAGRYQCCLSTSSKPPASDKNSSLVSAFENLKNLFATERFHEHKEPSPKPTKKPKLVVDSEPTADTKGQRLPKFFSSDEFPPENHSDKKRLQWEANRRIIRIAADRVLEPSAIALLTMSTSAVLGIAIAEGSLLTVDMPFFESMDAGRFVLRYAVEQLLPSCVWDTQDAKLVATAMGLDPSQLLQQLDPSHSAADAATILRVKLLASCRYMAAGFMLLAQLVRVGTIGVASTAAYEHRVRAGREPPLLPQNDGLVIRLCGKTSNVTATSLPKMGRHLFPVFEEPDHLYHLVSLYSDGYKIPVFWRVRPGRYGASFSWKGFHFHDEYLMETRNKEKVLILEADATNGDDPLVLGEESLDLTMDDASQGFQRLTEVFRSPSSNAGGATPQFRTLRVFLGNSLETFMSGGGHEYTLRHRIKYANEVDVLIDSRAPVLKEILRWCDRVAGEDRIVLFQTSNRQYFLGLQLLMQRYGYTICDPLDWKLADQLRDEATADDKPVAGENQNGSDQNIEYESLLQILLEDRIVNNIPRVETEVETFKDILQGQKRDRNGRIMRLSRLPRLVYYDKTAETVNAVQSLLKAGAVDISNCCALLDRQEGTEVLRGVLKKTEIKDWTRAPFANQDDKLPSSGHGLHMISSSEIYDSLFRQVRRWTRMGYTASDIQKELDTRYHQILKQSQEVYQEVVEVTSEEPADAKAVPVTEPIEDLEPIEDFSEENEAFETEKRKKT